MTKRVLLVGGYGNFGTFIARRLSRESKLTLIVAGRSQSSARALAELLGVEWAQIDIFENIGDHLKRLKPDVLIHTSGPFQEQSYEVAEACIRNGVHYLDLADGREFVVNITRLNAAARAAGVLVASGASTVPGLTSAVLTKYAAEFQTLDSIDFGISTAQKTNRGLATVKAAGIRWKAFQDVDRWADARCLWMARVPLAKISRPWVAPVRKLRRARLSPLSRAFANAQECTVSWRSGITAASLGAMGSDVARTELTLIGAASSTHIPLVRCFWYGR
jgi:NAD(P)-dependent dehydrogenase (short-subunit alcohol dehydrogenase family)